MELLVNENKIGLTNGVVPMVKNKRIEKINEKEIELDEECVNMVLFFNKIGLSTKFCCSGHGIDNFNIMFDKSVTDEQISDFIINFSNKFGHSPFSGKFSKWLRKLNGELVWNWNYTSLNATDAEHDYLLFINSYTYQ